MIFNMLSSVRKRFPSLLAFLYLV